MALRSEEQFINFDEKDGRMSQSTKGTHPEKSLDERTADPDPTKQFALWFDEAIAAQLPLPNVMTLATATTDGKPSARVVLLKSFDANGFVFYTNYNSSKSKELMENPRAALVMYWQEPNRQVRIEGIVQKISDEESDNYFQTRPLDSQISAVASPQSEVISSREELEKKFKEIEKHYRDQPVSRPSYWGGYRLKPTKIEFWQGRAARLHDRILYILQDDGSWAIKRLAP